MSARAARIDAIQTLVRVYRLPQRLTEGYCFGGDVPITFANVDWFSVGITADRDELVRFIKAKPYYRPAARFLVLGDLSAFTFVIEPEAQS